MQKRIPIMITLRGVDAALKAIKSLQGSEVQMKALQEYHRAWIHPNHSRFKLMS